MEQKEPYFKIRNCLFKITHTLLILVKIFLRLGVKMLLWFNFFYAKIIELLFIKIIIRF